MTTSRIRTVPKTKGKKKKKRKRIIESDNQSENDGEEDEPKIQEQCEHSLQDVDTTGLNEMLDVNKKESFENNMDDENNVEMKDNTLQEAASEIPQIPQIPQVQEMVPIQKIKKVNIFYFNYCNTRINIEYNFFRILHLSRKKFQLLDERYVLYRIHYIVCFSNEIAILLNFILHRLFTVDYQMRTEKKRRKY